MADDDANLVSEIKVEGADDAAAALRNYGDAGAAAFKKISDASDDAASKVGKSTGEIDDSVKKMNNSLGIAPATMQKLTGAASNLGTALSAGAKGASLFVTGVAGIVASGATAVVGLGKLASVLTATVRGVNDVSSAIKDQTQAQKKDNAQWGQSVASAAQYQGQLRTLDRQVATGRISYEEYNTQLMDLNTSYRDSVRVQQEVQEAQDEVLRRNQELEQQAAKRQEFEKLSQTFGTALTGSLIRLGTAYDSVSTKVVNAFGPVVGGLVDKLSALIERNAGTIEAFIDKTATALANFLKENEPAINEFLQGIISIARATGDFITGVLIPAFRGVVAVMDVVAKAINSVFGTNLSGVVITITAGIIAFTGALGSAVTFVTALATAIGLFLSALSPLGLALIAITAAIIALIAVDWTPLTTRAQAAWNAVVQFFTSGIETLKGIFTGFWQFLVDGWNQDVATIIAAWQTIVDWFDGFVATVGGIFTSIGQAIKDSFNSAIQYVLGLFSSWATSVMEYIKPVLDALTKVRALINATGGGGGGPATVNAASGGHIRGPGTGTSDSIPAWLSNGEFVVKAKSVAKYGLGLLHALNSGRLRLPGFSGGGSPFAMPSPRRFAAGGPVKGDRTSRDGATKAFDLHIGSEVFKGLLAPRDVAEKMVQFSVARGAASAGRKPNWVGNGS